MEANSQQRRPGRPARLSRTQILEAALELADRDGLEAVTMQRIARAIGAEPMSLYRHVRNKEDLLDGLVDLVFAEIELPSPDDPWKVAMRRRAVSVREALGRHPWAIGLMESRMNPGPANLRTHNAVMGSLREAGFSFRAAVHAASVLDAYIYGFALQEKSLPFESPEEHSQVIESKRQQVPDMADYPYLVEVATEMAKVGYDYATEFEFGLDLILDGLERFRAGG